MAGGGDTGVTNWTDPLALRLPATRPLSTASLSLIVGRKPW